MLVEWPERAGCALKADAARHRSSISRPGDGPVRASRCSAGTGGVRAAARSASRPSRRSSRRAAGPRPTRMHMQGDASTRAYERLVKPNGETAHPDDLAARARTARRSGAASPTARSPSSPSPCTPSWPWTRACARLGLQRAAIYGEDLETGPPDHRGSRQRAGGRRARARSRSATRRRRGCSRSCTPPTLPHGPAGRRRPRPRDPALRSRSLPDRGRAAARLVRAAHRRHASCPGSARAEFVNLWRERLEPSAGRPDDLDPARLSLAEPDLAARPGGARARRAHRFPGRRAGPPGLRRRLAPAGRPRDRAGRARAEAARPLCARAARAADPGFDVAAFARAYAIMGAQRATKILGIFARLDRRDGKPQYLQHLPRIEAYLARNLAHPALAKLEGLVRESPAAPRAEPTRLREPASHVRDEPRT